MNEQDELTLLQKAYSREKQARKEAERLLEDKIRSIVASKNIIDKQYQELQETHKKFRILNDRLIESRKLETVGLIISGLLHEINNPLASIQANIELLEYELSKEQISEINQDIKTGIDRVSKIINDLSSYKNKGEQSILDHEQCLRTAVKLCKDKADQNCQFNFEIGYPVSIKAYQADILQMYLQIILNALNAQANEISIVSHKRFNYVITKIRDNGTGISDSLAKKVFDPFYSISKNQNKGLGLYTSQQISLKYGGRVKIWPQRNGTMLTVTLPIKATNES